jgi:hypothetical protein
MALPFMITVDIPNAGTRVQVNNTPRMVVSITFKARNGNAGSIYIGTSNVSSTVGFELRGNESVTYTFPSRLMSCPISDFWLDTTDNGDDVDVAAILAP